MFTVVRLHFQQDMSAHRACGCECVCVGICASGKSKLEAMNDLAAATASLFIVTSAYLLLLKLQWPPHSSLPNDRNGEDVVAEANFPSRFFTEECRFVAIGAKNRLQLMPIGVSTEAEVLDPFLIRRLGDGA